MLKKSLIGLVVVALAGGGYYGYSSFRDHQVAEQKRLRQEASESLYKTIAKVSVDARSAREREQQELEERRKRIEAGTAKVVPVEEVTMHGEKHQYTLIDGKREGEYSVWYKSGRKSAESNYKDDRKISYISFYDEEGSPKQSEESNGPKQKRESFGWYKSGALQYQNYVSEEGPYDRKNNWSTGWYEDGTLSGETKYNNDTGFVDDIDWYPDGKIKQIRSTGFNAKNVSVEIYKAWYENGQQKIEEKIRGRIPDGRVYEWDEAGNLVTNELWVNSYLDRDQTNPKMIREYYQLKK